MSNLIAFLVLFGVLVFVHELGHFLMAKFFKVGVERFALGYGPKLLGRRWGETEYVICALPLGGYVKMVGDEPTDEQKAAQQNTKMPENSFLAKPPWQRIVIVLMGPFANLVLPVLLFVVLYMIGQPYLSSEVGYVSSDSVAKQAGILPGDKIIAVDSAPIKEWNKLVKSIESKPNQPVALTIQRGNEQLSRKLTPVEDDGLNPFGETIRVGRIGISPQSFELIVQVPDEKSAAHSAGLRTGDEIIAVGDKKVRFLWQLEQAILDSPSNVIQLAVKRKGATETTLNLQRAQLIDPKTSQLHLAKSGAYLQELVIERILPNSIAAEKGLQGKDILVSINEQPIQSWFSFQEKVRANTGEAMSLMVLRGVEPVKLDISPRVMEQKEELTGEKIRQRLLGVTTLGEVNTENIGTERILNPVKAFAMGVERCYEIAALTVIGFGKLLTGKVSSKSLGGPILIYQLAGKSWESGIHAFINMIVLISITLGILNLLPIPVLDGGHLMFYTIELIKGSPVQAKTREWAQQVGIVLLLALMVFAFYNDLGRISWSELGWVHWLRQLFS